MKTADDYRKERDIGFALFSMGMLRDASEYFNDERRLIKLMKVFLAPKMLGKTMRFLKGILPLIHAVNNREWQSIANAATAEINRDLRQEFFIDQQIQMIACCPERFGVKALSKADVLFIMQTTTPGWSPPNDMRKNWKKLGLDHLPQGRGYAPKLNKWARDYIASPRGKWEREMSQMGYPLFYLRS